MMSYFTALLSLLVSAPIASAAFSNDATVNATNGVYIGHKASNRTDAYEFLGIKYGQPPIGDLRFAPPRPYAIGSGSVFNASKWVRLADSILNMCQLTKG